MDRQEFSKMIADLRKESGMATKDVFLKLHWMPNEIYRIENGKLNYSLTKLIQYLEVLKLRLWLNDGCLNDVQIRNSQELVQFLKDTRISCGLTQAELAGRCGFSAAMVFKYETFRADIAIDTVLKVSDELKITIIIKKQKQQ